MEVEPVLASARSQPGGAVLDLFEGARCGQRPKPYSSRRVRAAQAPDGGFERAGDVLLEDDPRIVSAADAAPAPSRVTMWTGRGCPFHSALIGTERLTSKARVGRPDAEDAGIRAPSLGGPTFDRASS
jgi:hypothetical protein